MKPEEQDTAPGDYDVYGTILAYGPNRPWVLRDVLIELQKGCANQAVRTAGQTTRSPGFNVSHAWVRSVGNIGVVMLRFETTEEGYRNLRRQLPPALPDPEQRGRAPLLRVHRTGKPWHLDSRVRSGVLRYEANEAQWEEDGERVLDELLHNLAADPLLDVAQTDLVVTLDHPAQVIDDTTSQTRSREERVPLTARVVAANVRLFDLGRRGKFYLQEAIENAEAAILGTRTEQGRGERQSTYPWFAFLSDADKSQAVDKTTKTYISNALRGPVEGPHKGWESASVFVHALDVPGLLAEVTSSVRRQFCRIDRVCCRGLGRDAVVLLTVRWPITTVTRDQDGQIVTMDPLALERAIRDDLRQFFERETVRARITQQERGATHPAGYWNLYAERAPESASVAGSRERRDFVESTVCTVPDREWILIDLMEELVVLNRDLLKEKITSEGALASIYYLDLRPMPPAPNAHTGTESKMCEIGLGVVVQVEPGAAQTAAQACFSRWWDKALRRLQERRST